jgi:hypothetical protein
MYGYQPQPRPVARVQLAYYYTSFLLTENPISEGGRWSQFDTTNTNVQTVNGNAYGTQVNGAPFAPFDDSCAEIGYFGSNYEVTATIVKAAGLDAVNREVEIRLRCSSRGPLRSTAFGNTNSNGYEIAAQHNGNYMNLGRWKAANLVGPISGFGTPTTGDKFRARIEGQRIRVWWNDVNQIDFTDNDPDLKISSGNPGFGFFVNAGPPFPGNTDFGFSDLLVVQLP